MAEARAALAAESYVKPSRATINDFFEQYFPYAHLTVEQTTAANYETLARTYVMPIVGRRLTQDFAPSTYAAAWRAFDATRLVGSPGHMSRGSRRRRSRVCTSCSALR